MSRGASPKPAFLHAIEGTRALGKHVVKDSVEGKKGAPRMPHGVSDGAKRVWPRIVKILDDLGVLTEADAIAVQALCEVYARWLEAVHQIERFGMVIKAPSGYVQVSPYWGVMNRSGAELRRMLIEFGMTPSSRTRIKSERAEAGEFDDV